VGPAIGRAVVAVAAMCASASSGNSTAARSVGCSPDTIASTVGTAARATAAASNASAIHAGRDSTRVHITAIVAPAASATSGQNSTNSTLSSAPVAIAEPRTSAAPVTAVQPATTPSSRTGTPRADSGRNAAATATTMPIDTSARVRNSESPLEPTLGSTAIAAAVPNSAVRPEARESSVARRQVISPPATPSAAARGSV
jgi:hypothetical protein